MAIMPTYFPNFFTLLNKIIFALPENVRREKFAPVYGFQTMQRLSRERVEHAIERADKENVGEEKKESEEEITTMFDLMLHPDVSKGQVTPSKRDMIADGCLMIAAGTDTTANTLGTVFWNVTQNPEVEAKLFEELKAGMGKDEIMDSVALEGEGFVYLRAVVKEALRLSYGVPGKMSRRVPKEGAKFGDVFVPGGVGSSLSLFVSF